MVRRIKLTDKENLLKLVYEFDRFHRDNFVTEELTPFNENKDSKSQFEEFADKCSREDGYTVFVAESGEDLVGYGALEIRSNPNRVLDKEGFVEDLFVSNDYRGQGIGQELLEAMENEAKKQGCNVMRLDVMPVNLKALGLYHKFGFIDNTIELLKKL